MAANSFDGDEEWWASVNHSVTVAGIREVDFDSIGVDILALDIVILLLAAGVVGSADYKRKDKRLIVICSITPSPKVNPKIPRSFNTSRLTHSDWWVTSAMNSYAAVSTRTEEIVGVKTIEDDAAWFDELNW